MENFLPQHAYHTPQFFLPCLFVGNAQHQQADPLRVDNLEQSLSETGNTPYKSLCPSRNAHGFVVNCLDLFVFISPLCYRRAVHRAWGVHGKCNIAVVGGKHDYVANIVIMFPSVLEHVQNNSAF